MSQDPVLVLSRVAKSYRAGVLGCAATVEVIRGLSLSVRPGEFVTVEGARGAGKTTLMQCAAGMLRPDSGSVSWPMLPKRSGRPPSLIGYAADRAPMYGFLTVRESIAYAATVRELHDPGPANDLTDVLALANLESCAALRVALLEPAERARLLLAFALIGTPKLLLVDDVGATADAVGRAAFVRCLARIATSGVAVLWAARRIGIVSYATNAYELVSGTLREAGLVPVSRASRVSLELDVAAVESAEAALADCTHAVERRNGRLRVSLQRATAEEILALCRDLAIPVRASRVVREVPNRKPGDAE